MPLSAVLRAKLKRLSRQPPADDYAIEEAARQLGVHFPQSYTDLLHFSNGLEGFAFPELYVQLWSVESLAALNMGHLVPEFLPEYYLIGTDGANCGFLLSRELANEMVLCTDLVGMPDRDPKECAPSLLTFLERFSNSDG